MDVDMSAIVSRGGRLDLSGSRLPDVQVSTLLIVGGYDDYVLALNRQAQDMLGGQSRLEIVPGATHLFEEPGTLRQVAHRASDWYVRENDAGRKDRSDK
jgi:putative phosphoribosyl transferase